jgi:hypothetical protein
MSCLAHASLEETWEARKQPSSATAITTCQSVPLPSLIQQKIFGFIQFPFATMQSRDQSQPATFRMP